MSNNNDFEFDDLFGDEDEDISYGLGDEEDEFPLDLGDESESDMPEMEDEPESGGPNRTFVLLAGLMILLFVVALVVVLFLATRPTGPSDIELTASQVVMLNSTVLAQGAATSTQNAADFFLTQTAAAWTSTPSPTLSPTPQATVTPTPTVNMSALLAETQTAAAALAPPVNLDLRSAFATQLALATQQGQFDQAAFATRVALATQSAGSQLDPAAEAALRNALEATQAAINQQAVAAQTAIAFIDQALATHSVSDQAFAADLGNANANGQGTQAALETPFAAATIAASGTQSALATLSADVQQQTGYLPREPGMAKVNPPGQTRAEMATQVAMMPAAQDAGATATAAVLGTRSAIVTQIVQATRGALATQAAQATQNSLGTQAPFATQAAIATQVSLATRQALIEQALGVATSTPSGGLEAVNQTATAIAGAFLTATAQSNTPLAPTITPVVGATLPFGGPTATALPTTGIFDDVVGGGGGSMGVLALAVFGLVGVIVVSRRLRNAPPPPDDKGDSPENE